MEMIDFACRSDQPIDTLMAESLRTEAMRVRFEAILTPHF
jgi:hypothetical protein